MGVQTDIMEDQLIWFVAEVHMIQHHAAFQLCIGHGSVRLVGMPPGPYVGPLLGLGELSVRPLFGIDQLHIALVGFRLLVHQFKDPLGAGGGGDHKVDLLADLGNGLGKALVQAHKGDHRAQRHTRQAVDAQHRSHNGHHHIAEPADVVVDRHQQIGVAVGLVGALAQGLVDPGEIRLGCLLMAEYQSPESPEHLCEKTIPYAQQWKPVADTLWQESHSQQPS